MNQFIQINESRESIINLTLVYVCNPSLQFLIRNCETQSDSKGSEKVWMLRKGSEFVFIRSIKYHPFDFNDIFSAY